MSQALAAIAAGPARPQHHRAPITLHLLRETPCVAPEHSNLDVFRLFDGNPALGGLPVVEAGTPIGLINRNIFMDSFARPFHREVYSRKSCIAFMDKGPLVVEASLPLQDLSFRALSTGGKTLSDGFIITEAGRYLGMGSGTDMVAAISHLQAEKNRQIMESIDYASVIQHSFLRPSRETLRRILPNHLLVWEPRDVVGGDYFFFSERGDGFFGALCDCTGHGVPGAFMTLIMSSFLDHALDDANWQAPGQLLSTVNVRVKTALGQIDHSHVSAEESDEEAHRSDDGMDAAFIAFNRASGQLHFAGAHQLLMILRPDGEAVEFFDGDPAGVGYAGTALDQAWQTRSLELAPGTLVCICTDGVYDQPGGPKRIAFGKKRLAALLLANREADQAQLRHEVMDSFTVWQGEEARRDDVTIFAFRT